MSRFGCRVLVYTLAYTKTMMYLVSSCSRHLQHIMLIICLTECTRYNVASCSRFKQLLVMTKFIGPVQSCVRPTPYCLLHRLRRIKLRITQTWTNFRTLWHCDKRSPEPAGPQKRNHKKVPASCYLLDDTKWCVVDVPQVGLWTFEHHVRHTSDKVQNGKSFGMPVHDLPATWAYPKCITRNRPANDTLAGSVLMGDTCALSYVGWNENRSRWNQSVHHSFTCSHLKLSKWF